MRYRKTSWQHRQFSYRNFANIIIANIVQIAATIPIANTTTNTNTIRLSPTGTVVTRTEKGINEMSKESRWILSQIFIAQQFACAIFPPVVIRCKDAMSDTDSLFAKKNLTIEKPIESKLNIEIHT